MANKNKSSKFANDRSFYVLADSIAKAIETNEDGTVKIEQLEKMIGLEEKFRKEIVKRGQSREIYKKFILKIMVENKNLLSSRPYFRERAAVFKSKISPAIKEAKIESLQTFHINYNLVEFIRANWLGPFPARAQQLYDQFIEARRILIENNTPLAVNRAKIFYSKTPQSHLSLNDLIGVAFTGLISGVDKVDADMTDKFGITCVGRITGNMIGDYSETQMHFYPSDHALLYRARSLIARHKVEGHEIVRLVALINESYKEDTKNGVKAPAKPVTVGELVNLLGASSFASTDAILTQTYGADNETMKAATLGQDSIWTDEPEPDAESALILKDSRAVLVASAQILTVVERKVIKLKGVDV